MNEENNYVNIERSSGVLLQDLLGGFNKIYEIPLFQRNYNWTTDNCKELYDDIIESYRKKTSHFIGIFIHYSSIASSNKNSFVLIDGQQRMTTIMLLLCAIRDVTDNEKLKENINKSFIYNTNKEIKFRFKLKQNNFDNDNFEKVLDNKIESIQTKSKIYINYSKFIEWLSEEKNIDFNELLECIKRMEAVEILLKSNDIENVQSIFEKINSTGQPLSAADLIRNYLLFTGNLREQQNLYDMWTCIEKIVGSNNITQFVKAYTIRFSFEIITSRNIYNSFKNQFKSIKHEKILAEMLEYAKYYAIIKENKYYKYDSNFNVELVEYNNKQLNNTLKMLDALGTDDLIPLFLMLFNKINNREKIEEILELILEFMIRYRIVQPSAGGGALQAKIYGMMKDIENGNCPLTIKAIYNRLSTYDSDASRYPTDSQFISSLKENMHAKDGRVLLYQYARRMGYEIIEFDSDLTLEHIMPQTIDPNKSEGKWWIKNLGSKKYKETQENYTDCIGNYTLLTRSLNATVSNGPWPNKRKDMLTKAFDAETRKVANMSKWNEATIRERNELFSVELSKVITGPKTENKNKNWLI